MIKVSIHRDQQVHQAKTRAHHYQHSQQPTTAISYSHDPTTPASLPPPPLIPAINSLYRNTSPFAPALLPLSPLPPKCRRLVKSLKIPSTSLSLILSNSPSPGSGAVLNSAYLSSPTSICPLSSVSNASNAARSSSGWLRDARGAERLSRYLARVRCAGPVGGKNSRRVEGSLGRPSCSRVEVRVAGVRWPEAVGSRT